MKRYQHLLLAMDVYENDISLFDAAIHLARRYNAKLSIVHVMPKLNAVPFIYDFQEAIVDHAKQILNGFKEKFALSDEQIIIAQGPAAREIVRTAETIGADLILCGSHGKHGIELLLGSTANALLHLSPIDVLTIRTTMTAKHLTPAPYKHIVLALDLHKDYEVVAAQALEWANTFGATLFIIHVIADLAAMGYYPAIEFDLSKQAEAEMNALVSEMAIPVAKENIYVRTGLPKQEILALSKEVGAELIIMGSHAKSALSYRVLGSTANAVLHGAESDILVVRV